MPTPDFDKLNSDIQEAGADWIAGETPYSHLYGVQGTMEGMGLALTPEDVFESLQETRQKDAEISFAAAPPPRKVDWRSVNGQNFVTNVKDQSSCGSCVSFATVATVESRTLIDHDKPGYDLDLSEAHLFYCGTPNSCNFGWQPRLALDFCENHGLGMERDFPYTPGDQPCRQIPIVLKTDGRDAAATMEARKRAVGKGPAIASMAVYGDFFSYKSGVYRHVEGELSGYHAVCVIGYDDDAGYWIAKNSWSKNWGESGFFKIHYGECGFDSQFPFYFPESISTISSPF